jgi:hypothetical protein
MTIAGGQSLNGRGLFGSEDLTAPRHLDGVENGTIHTNKGATACIVTIRAARGRRGHDLRVLRPGRVRAAHRPQRHRDHRPAVDRRPGRAGKYLSADAVGEWVRLKCVETGKWFCMGYFGTWTAES